MNIFQKILAGLFVLYALQSCSATRKTSSARTPAAETKTSTPIYNEGRNSEAGNRIPARVINTKNAEPGAVVDFAETLVGVPYKYGSAIKEKGFDCSGFVSYVFNHFNVAVPRVSKDFTNAGTQVPLSTSKKGDLILFTGTDTTGWIVGHMGFIVSNDNGKIKFIHSSSGKSIGVIISEMRGYYAARFVKVIRVFNN